MFDTIQQQPVPTAGLWLLLTSLAGQPKSSRPMRNCIGLSQTGRAGHRIRLFMLSRFKTKHLRISNASDIARNEEYRNITENSIRIQQDLREGQDKMMAELSQIRNRMTAIEKMLREVD
ncbi:hypothetical protein [Paenibacillus nasutitermitis]|nr:hypothetical protein [Paenibacillus nasutitermitis]